MNRRIPNLFVVGAMRAGTTALHEALGQHPEIFMSKYKEPAFFADPAELAADSRIISAAGYAGNKSKYLDLFREAGEVKYAGESSTHYTKAPRINGVALRIAAMAQDARIIYLVRDPVERTLSHYRFAVRRKEERRSAIDALRQEPFYCAVSDYATQIRPFLAEFGEDQVHFSVLEQLVANPEAELTTLFRWLGIRPLADPADLFTKRNEMTSEFAQARGPDVFHRMGRSAGYQQVARTLLPSRLRGAVRRTLNRTVTSSDVRTPDVVDYLRSVHAAHVADFEQLTGRQIPEWSPERAG